MAKQRRDLKINFSKERRWMLNLLERLRAESEVAGEHCSLSDLILHAIEKVYGDLREDQDDYDVPVRRPEPRGEERFKVMIYFGKRDTDLEAYLRQYVKSHKILYFKANVARELKKLAKIGLAAIQLGRLPDPKSEEPSKSNVLGTSDQKMSHDGL